MNLLAAIPGILLPALIGWCAVRLVEGKTPVLTNLERAGWSLTAGPTVSMLAVFISAAAGITDFSLSGFLIPLLVLVVFLAGLLWFKRIAMLKGANVPALPEPVGIVKYGILALTLWTALKLIAGAYDLITVPTYWDDSFNNWNMRGKIFYESRAPVLEIPVGNGIVQTAQGVSSYPPSLPLMKTWVSVLRGDWEEPLVNGIQLVWVLGLLCVFFGTLRRRFGVLHSLLGTSLLVSLPLVLIQAMNPYAEIFVAAHLLLCVSALWNLSRCGSADEGASWLRICGLGTGALLFTKNEALLIYLPLLAVTMLWTIRPMLRAAETRTTIIRAVVTACGLLILTGLPWILFKWTHGLTFGNAKAVSGIAVAFSSKAFGAIWHNLTHEPNTLLLPLVLPIAVIAAWKTAFRLPNAVLTLFVAGAVGIQFLLFTFVGALETEAVMQTGLGRGLVQVAPVAMFLLILCVRELLDETTDAS